MTTPDEQEQRLPADGGAAAPVGDLPLEADEADALEQAEVVLLDEDEDERPA